MTKKAADFLRTETRSPNCSVFARGKKALSPVVAMSLLLILAVVGITTFQIWFSGYQSQLSNKVELQSSQATQKSQIEKVIDDSLYFNNKATNNVTINKITIKNQTCSINQNYTSGIHKINISNCTQNLSISTYDVVVHTNENIYGKKFFNKNENINSSSTPQPVQTLSFDPNNDLGSGSLSQNNTVWTPSNKWDNARSEVCHDSGKWYFELEFERGLDTMSGIAFEGHSQNWVPNGGGAGVAPWKDYIYYSNTDDNSHGNTAANHPEQSGITKYMYAVDLDNGYVFFGINGTWYNGPPSSGSGAAVHSVVNGEGPLDTSLTYCITGSAWAGYYVKLIQPNNLTYSVPSGYNKWKD